MSEIPGKKPAKERPSLAEQVGAKAARKIKAQRSPPAGVFFGLGMMGLIGWSVVVPTLLGAAFGNWLDRHHPGSYSYTLMLLMAGLVVGCFNAWNWVEKEDRAMHQEDAEEKNEH